MFNADLKIGLIGSGNWGRNHLRVLASLKQVQLVGVCDLDPEVLQRVARTYPGVTVTNDARDLLRRVDAVVIASSARSHYALAKQALDHGLSVFVEKPLALKMEQGKELVRLAEQRNRILMVGHLLLFHPGILKLKEIVDQGELGQVYYLYSQRLNLGRIRRDENVMWSLAPHDLSVANFLLNQRPLRVSATGKSFIQPHLEDVAFLVVEYEHALAHIHVSWLDPHKIRSLTVVGSQKMAVFDDMQPEEKLKIYDKGVDPRALQEPEALPPGAIAVRYGDIYAPKIEMREPLKVELEHFVQAVRTHQEPRSSGREALAVLRILDAAERSMKGGGQWINLG